MTVHELEEIVGELYLLPPADFVAARNELVRRARAYGNREFADRLQHLRRPTRSAWLVNLLARHDAEEMKRLSTVGRELREAQTGLDGTQLRHLGEQRRQLIADLLDRARHRAAEAGLRLTDGVLSEVEATLHAALVDLAGALTVRNGRLARPLSHDGFGPRPHVDFRPVAPPARQPTGEGEPDRSRPPVNDELAARRGRTSADSGAVEGMAGTRRQSLRDDVGSADDSRAEAVRNLRWAEEELAAAESVHWQREYELADAAAALEAANDMLNWLDSQWIEARRDKVTAQQHLAEAQSQQRDAASAVEGARRRLEIARQLAGTEQQS